MNKLPAKQIYLLSIIIIGIIALSVYSTYALFTYESQTSDVVSIHIAKSLSISENIYEYQQITIEPNSISTVDVDIYNTFEYDVCYSVWYEIVGDNDIKNNVQIFEKTENNLTTSGILTSNNNLTVSIVMINDNDTTTKVNLGTIGSATENETCSLNLASDKNLISEKQATIDSLVTKILENKDKTTKTESSYLTYKISNDVLKYNETDEVYVSTEFTYNNEEFTLVEPKKMTLKEVLEQYSLQINNVHFCTNNTSCKVLYKINEIKVVNDNEKYQITNYDKLVGYMTSTNGLRKVNTNDYIYYGDNPNNYIYYNCENISNPETCELWRIVGLFYNQETKEHNIKIVRNQSIGKYQFDYKMENEENISSNAWNISNLNKYLNEEYKIYNDNYIVEYNQSVERIPNLETDIKDIKIKEESINSKISILNLSDYIYASSCNKTMLNEYTNTCLTNNWLNNVEVLSEWTLTSKEIVLEEETENEENNTTTESTENENTELEEDNEIPSEEVIEEEIDTRIINYVYSVNDNIIETDVNELLDVRPVVFLKSRMILIDGDGSLTSPYIIK